MKRFHILIILVMSMSLDLCAQTIFPRSADKRNYAVITMKDGTTHEGYLATYVSLHKSIKLRKTPRGGKQSFDVKDMRSFVLMNADHSDPDSSWVPMMVGKWKGEGKIKKKYALLMKKKYNGQNITGYYCGYMDSNPAPRPGTIGSIYYRQMFFVQQHGEDWVLKYPDVDKGLLIKYSNLYRTAFKRYPEIVDMVGNEIKLDDVRKDPLIFMYKLDDLLNQPQKQ